ncbi:hypothetical protein AX15_003156 [Amanita polypyramis BW_CC]|nr:hypothetical protein AX15_003156 [Amanita polypyramis BW_CC]
MYRSLLAFIVLFTTFSMTFAVPIPLQDDTTVGLEKRVAHSGRGTWFHVGLGNCGDYDNDGEPIVAISKALYDQNNGSNCNQWMQIVNSSNGRKVYAKVRDSCPDCSYGDLDMSPSIFSSLASLSTGEIHVSWHFMGKSWRP